MLVTCTDFREKTDAFISPLPITPEDMPFVMVRPRSCKNQQKRGSPFKLAVDQVRRAYAWLNQFIPYYRAIAWVSPAEEAWRNYKVQVGDVREDNFDLDFSEDTNEDQDSIADFF